jgi:hypothetical protein
VERVRLARNGEAGEVIERRVPGIRPRGVRTLVSEWKPPRA